MKLQDSLFPKRGGKPEQLLLRIKKGDGNGVGPMLFLVESLISELSKDTSKKERESWLQVERLLVKKKLVAHMQYVSKGSLRQIHLTEKGREWVRIRSAAIERDLTPIEEAIRRIVMRNQSGNAAIAPIDRITRPASKISSRWLDHASSLVEKGILIRVGGGFKYNSRWKKGKENTA